MKALLEALEETLIGLLLVALTLLVFVEVILRFGFGTGVIWAQEVSLYLGAWFILIGASYALRVGAHIAVDAVVNLLAGPVKRAVAVLAIGLSLLYCGILAAAARDVAIPRWLGQSAVLLCFLMLGARLIALLLAVLRGEAAGFKHLDEAQEALDALAEHDAQDKQPDAGRK